MIFIASVKNSFVCWISKNVDLPKVSELGAVQ